MKPITPCRCSTQSWTRTRRGGGGAALDPARAPGRLTLIVRMGHRIHERLPPIVEAVAANGHRVVWLSDPMHGNTVPAADWRKTRYVDDLLAEAVAFRRILAERGEHAGGLHLEVAAGDVTECVGASVADESSLGARYTTLCDPRLNPAQARALIVGWRQRAAGARGGRSLGRAMSPPAASADTGAQSALMPHTKGVAHDGHRRRRGGGPRRLPHHVVADQRDLLLVHVELQVADDDERAQAVQRAGGWSPTSGGSRQRGPTRRCATLLERDRA